MFTTNKHWYLLVTSNNQTSINTASLLGLSVDDRVIMGGLLWHTCVFDNYNLIFDNTLFTSVLSYLKMTFTFGDNLKIRSDTFWYVPITEQVRILDTSIKIITYSMLIIIRHKTQERNIFNQHVVYVGPRKWGLTSGQDTWPFLSFTKYSILVFREKIKYNYFVLPALASTNRTWFSVNFVLKPHKVVIKNQKKSLKKRIKTFNYSHAVCSYPKMCNKNIY